MTDQQLANLNANALRLSAGGAAKFVAEAERLLPLIAAELEKRRAAKPPPRPRKAAPKK